MTYTVVGVQELLATTEPFNSLSSQDRERLCQHLQPLRYRMGQAIIVRETMPSVIAILYSGQARLLGYPQGATAPTTLALLQPGSVLGWISVLRGIACETAIASSETICLTFPIPDFLELLKQHPQFADTFFNQCHLVEVFDLLGLEIQRQAKGGTNLKDLAINAGKEATILNLPPGKTPLHSLDPNRVWLISCGSATNFNVGDRLSANSAQEYIKVSNSGSARIIGLRLPNSVSEPSRTVVDTVPTTIVAPETNNPLIEIPYAPERPIPNKADTHTAKATKYPFVGGRGSVNATLAVFQMLAQHLGMPFRRDVLRRALTNSFERTGGISLQLCGAASELMSLKSQLLEMPAVAISRIPTPAMLPWQDSFALLYSANESELVLAIPESGIRRMKPRAFIEAWGESGQVLLLQQTADTPTRRFGISWFVPSIIRYRKVLIEVFIASFFVQLLGLANPLMTQVIIDKVLVQNSIDTLNILGIFLIVIAIFEAVITSIRTNLFVDTTNRIDLALGAQVIDHLLRLPLRYFERRPVGELATRVGELENIRQFLTGTALTVVLDAVFSVIYIVVMIVYSPLLTNTFRLRIKQY